MPQVPILFNDAEIINAVYAEVIVKKPYIKKKEIISNVQDIMEFKENSIVFGLGNRVTDNKAYSESNINNYSLIEENSKLQVYLNNQPHHQVLDYIILADNFLHFLPNSTNPPAVHHIPGNGHHSNGQMQFSFKHNGLVPSNHGMPNRHLKKRLRRK